MAQDTIYALASGMGRAGVAVVRVSGPGVRDVAKALCDGHLSEPRRATLSSLRGSSGSVIDEGLTLFFAAPNSFTGEDVVEFHVHGGRAILEALFSAFDEFGLRVAGPGEFTRRAVENGKLDLTRAEAIADLVNAETAAQHRQALGQYGGQLAQLYDAWRARLIRALAWAEAAIDFSDEELPAGMLSSMRLMAAEILEEIQGHLKDAHRGERIREGIYLTVVGAPNAGKSSLVNALAKRDVAIVNSVPGTTRDVIEVRLDLDGYPVTVADTAGIRETKEAVETEGVRRALERARTADLVLWLRDGSLADEAMPVPSDFHADLIVWNKADLAWPRTHEGLKLSLKTGQGLQELLQALADRVNEKLATSSEGPVLTRQRHRKALEDAAECLLAMLAAPAGHPELAAEDLRLAVRAIGRITGAVDLDELLDVVFREFCVGK